MKKAAPKDPKGKPDVEDFARTLVLISGLKFAPPKGPYDDEILELLDSLVGTREQLAWLNQTLRDSVTEWPGLPQLRALFCTHFAPADGYDNTSIDFSGPRISCAVPGFTPDDFAGRQPQIQEAKRLELMGGQKMLTAGNEISEDPEMRQMLRDVAAKLSMPGPLVIRKKA